VKKILFIHHAAGWGGAPVNMINIINSLDKNRYVIQVLLIKDSIVSNKLKESGIDYVIAESFFYKIFYQYYTHTVPGFIKWFNIGRQFIAGLSWIFSRYYFASRELKKLDFNIVHLNSSVLTDWLKPCSSRGKVVIHIQEPLSKGYMGIRLRVFKYHMAKYSNKIVAISKDNAKRVGIPEKTEIIYNYYDVPGKPPEEKSYYSKKILYLGGDASIKGFYTLIESLDYLEKEIKIYFGGSYKKEKNYGAIKRIIKNLLFIGRKKKAAIHKLNTYTNAIEIGMTDKVQKYLNEVCCLISPFSVSHFSRPVIEAQLYKKPVIVTDVDGINEIVEHDKNGLIIPKNNPKALAKAINDLTSNGEKAKKLGEAGYAEAIKKFTPKNVKEFELLYDRLFIKT